MDSAASSYTVAFLSQSKAFSTAFLIAGIAAAVGFAVMFLVKTPIDKVKK